MTRVRLHLLAAIVIAYIVLCWYAAHVLFGTWMP